MYTKKLVLPASMQSIPIHDILYKFNSDSRIQEMKKYNTFFGELMGSIEDMSMDRLMVIDAHNKAISIKRIYIKDRDILCDFEVVNSKSGKLVKESIDEFYLFPRCMALKEDNKILSSLNLITIDIKSKTHLEGEKL